MNDRPTSVELLRAVERFLAHEVVPELSGPRKYHARVAANVVAIVAREIETEDVQLRGEWRRLYALLGLEGAAPETRETLRDEVRSRAGELAERIRRGDCDVGPFRDAVIAHLRRTVADKLDVAQPRRRRV